MLPSTSMNIHFSSQLIFTIKLIHRAICTCLCAAMKIGLIVFTDDILSGFND